MQKVPTYLSENACNIKSGDYLSVDIQSKNGNTLFEVYYYGDLFEVKRKKLPCIVDNKTGIPCKIVAKDTETGEEILLFDGYRHGYNAMFCDEFDPEEVEKRTLVKYNIAPCKIHIDFGYSIDYEEEKEDYEVDEADRVTLINGETISWEEVKRNGFDYISIICETENGEKAEIVSLELA
ncbi:hypothetical protein [Capnocytophaga gingivalis]|uniref:hypothetical protein n=1 Tax=Capnocytophaga gingivalis TaxID=1017 RepID=UPI0028D1E7B2|nr:hypothetical protein [Capnocytophaga gingivalis]